MGPFFKGLLWGLFVKGPLCKEANMDNDMDKCFWALVTMNRKSAKLVFGN
jgi:hypothetical protein